jgi:DNA helicase HerA-like ATPase
VIVLEEAQNYIREATGNSPDSIAREVFERIAREGRKYGLGLIVASQRPSELSKTVLSQCNSFIVHRLQNPEDLRYFREIVPGIYKPLLDQLPALAQRNALVLGECVRAPALVYMREASPVPKSSDPLFFKNWTAEKAVTTQVEDVCAYWERGAAPKDLNQSGASHETATQPSKKNS